MEYYFYISIILLAAAAIGFFIGAPKYLRPRRPLYASMIVLGVGCIMIGKIYTFLRILTGLPVFGVFHVGILGTVGAFAFFFSANFGQIDSLVDSGDKEFMKYRIIAVAGILITGILYTFILLSPATTAEKFKTGIAAISIAAASYFHVKHILIPDIDYGVVSCQRGYNIIALIYGISCMLEMTATSYSSDILLFISCALQCAASAIIVPVMDKGVQKWSK